MRSAQRLFLALLSSIFLFACSGGGSITDDGGGGTDPVETISIELSSSVESDVEIDATTGAVLTATVTSSTNGAVSGELVTFALNNAELGTFSNETATAVTNSSGVATISIFSANIAGSGSVSATIESGESVSLAVTMKGDGTTTGSNTLSISLVDASGNVINEISDAVPGEIHATYLDVQGNAITGELATFSTKLGLGVLNPTTGTSITDENGVAKISLTAGTVAGADEVTVEIGESIETIGFTTLGDVSVVDPIDEYEILLTVEDSANTELRDISQSTPGTALATLTKLGEPVAFEPISFMVDGEGIVNPTSGNALTGSNGVAAVTLLTGDIKGAGTLTAEFALGNDVISESFSFSVAGDAEGGDGEVNDLVVLLVDSGGNQTNFVSQEFPGRAQVFLNDSDGAPLVNKVITFSSTLGDFLPNSGTALTDTSGKAEILITAGTIEGAATLTASFGSSEASIGFETAGDDIDPVAAEPSITFDIYDCNDAASFDKSLKNFEVCTITDNITNQRPGILGAVVTLEGSNQPLKQVLVSAGTTLGAISPASATAITDADGKAILDLYSDGAVGAGEVSLKVKQVTSSKAFEIGRVDIDLEVTTYIGTGTIPAGGSTVIEVTVLDPDGNIETTQPFTLEFSSQCMSAGNALIDSPVVTNAGKGFATYRSINCQGTDTITVSAITGASTVTSTTDVSIDTIEVGAIQFIEASPTKLAIKGSGGLAEAGARSETSQVSFKLLNEIGQAAASQRVCFELSTELGGMVLSPAPIAEDFENCPNMPKVGDAEYPSDITEANKYAVAYTDANGDVSVTVRSGYVATPVKVFAVWQDESDPTSLPVSNVSDSLTVTTGLSDYNSFSLSASVLNVEGWNHDGETSTVTIRAADHFNNPVPEGTVVHFRTEGGNIGQGDLEGSCTTVSNTGTCSVTWTSSNPRPFDDTTVVCPVTFNGSSLPPCTGATMAGYTDGSSSIIPEPRPGRSTITAYAIGEESFVDLNGNGLFDTGEDWTDLSEAFFDHNEDGSYRDSVITPLPLGAIEEEFIDYNNDQTFNLADGLYTGLLCAAGSESSCSQTGINNTQSQLNVFRNMPIVMSGSVPYGRLVDIDDAGNITPVTDIDLRSVFDTSVPPVDIGLSSKTIYLFVSDVNNNTLANGTTITAQTENGDLATATTSYTIGNNTSNKPLLYAFTVSRESSANQKTSGLLSITVQTLFGDAVTYTVSVLDNG
ncbi:invasin [Shewanella sp. TC10]|uniref:invasin n=1 Tax=Shewanella sp. TC10 TaxID=1419739 RepID=UPI00129DBE0E|nr:invasin [Shewanella sp. TC10]